MNDIIIRNTEEDEDNYYYNMVEPDDFDSSEYVGWEENLDGHHMNNGNCFYDPNFDASYGYMPWWCKD